MSATLGNAGQDVIGGAIDRGVIGASRHGMEFYGNFPHWQTLGISVACTQGGEVNPTVTPYVPAVRVDGRAASQINITFTDIPSDLVTRAGLGTRCSFTPTDARGIATGPLWGRRR